MHDRKRDRIVEAAIRHSQEMSDLMDGGLGAARELFKELFTWCPEYFEVESVETEWAEREGKRGELPLFSELAMYEILGKENARGLLGMLRRLGEALGFSDEEMHRGFEEKEDQPSTATQDDFDVLEAVLRSPLNFGFENSDKRRVARIMRALGDARTVAGASDFTHGGEVKYLRCYPEDLRVGDRIIQDGSIIEVLGFFDEDGNPSTTPVPDRLSDLDREVYDRKLRKRVKKPYWGARVKWRSGDTQGFPLRSEDEHTVQRSVG